MTILTTLAEPIMTTRPPNATGHLKSVLWGVMMAGLLATGESGLAREQHQRDVRVMPAQTTWDAVPAQAPSVDGYVDINGVKLWYWDTGGKGEPVVLLHPATGSAAIWGYQQPELVKAGFRVIAFSRRGHYRSDAGPLDKPGSAVDDIQTLVDFLGLGKFHLVGSAAGGFIVPDYALSHPDRLLSITIACSTGGVTDADYREVYSAMLATPQISALPTWIKELSPSYRAANASGVAQWMALEKMSRQGERVRQARKIDLSWAAVATIQTPALLLTGDADIYMPPSRLRQYAAHMQNPEVVVISESGHSAYWEQPLAFNRVLIEFLRRHKRMMTDKVEQD